MMSVMQSIPPFKLQLRQHSLVLSTCAAWNSVLLGPLMLGNGLPLAKSARPPEAAMASSKVHSALVVGLLRGNMMGRLLQADIACRLQSLFNKSVAFVSSITLDESHSAMHGQSVFTSVHVRCRTSRDLPAEACADALEVSTLNF